MHSSSLPNFKELNDVLSHQSGDEILIEVGHRLQSRVSAADTVGRLGGDEIVILLTDPNDPATVAAGIVARSNEPFALHGHELHPQGRPRPDHRSFVSIITTGNESLPILRSMTATASHLGLHITAEGIGTPEQALHLLRSNCDALQGYLFSPPPTGNGLPAAEIYARLNHQGTDDQLAHENFA